MKIRKQALESNAQRTRATFDYRKPVVAGGLGLVAALTVGIISVVMTNHFFPQGVSSSFWSAAQSNGFAILRDDIRLRDTVLRTPTYIARLARHPILPQMSLDIEFLDIQKLQTKRLEALEAGLLEASDDDYVSAVITTGDGSVRAKVRLKGDNVDHLGAEKWSLRIHIKGDDSIFGLRHFSIQHPKTRGFHAELLFQESLRQFGVITPEYFFVNVTVNGNNIGIMAVEEFFSKEMLERNGRKDGITFKFDEYYRWHSRDMKNFRRDQNYAGPFESYLVANLHIFRQSSVDKSSDLQRSQSTAIGLMRGFLDRRLDASDVFDVDLMASYLANSEFWGAPHAVHWTNLRFYYNPLTMRLEPISYDANLQGLNPIGRSINREPIVVHMLQDPALYQSFMKSYGQLHRQLNDGSLPKALREVEANHLEILQSEFFMLEPFDPELLQRRAKFARDILRPDVLLARTPTFSNLYDVRASEFSYLELVNVVPYEVVVHDIYWLDEGLGRLPFTPTAPLTMPFSLQPTPVNDLPYSRRINYEPLKQSASRELHVVTAIHGYEKQNDEIAQRNFPPISVDPRPAATLSELLDRHPYLSADRRTKTIRVEPGIWSIDEAIVVPDEFTLVIEAGTTLRFGSDAYLLVFGATRFNGTSEARIVLEGTDETWQGVLVFEAAKRSVWTNVVVHGTTGLNTGDWQFTGGTTFYQSDVDISGCLFDNNKGEDALHIIHSDFSLKNSLVSNTVSDALDADFSTGRIDGGAYSNIGTAGGGDGVDVSGSVITINGTRFESVSDKAISVGEGSQLIANSITIIDSGVGAASKDGSTVELLNATISNARYAGVMAYTKKREYGAALLTAEQTTVSDSPRVAQVQTGSRLVLNGEQIPTDDVDIETLYNTIMKPGIDK